MNELQEIISKMHISELLKISAKVAECEMQESAENPARGCDVPNKQYFWVVLHGIIKTEIEKERKEQ